MSKRNEKLKDRKGLGFFVDEKKTFFGYAYFLYHKQEHKDF